MINFEQQTFHRFELMPNTRNGGVEQAFILYGVLLFPVFLGGILLYNCL